MAVACWVLGAFSSAALGAIIGVVDTDTGEFFLKNDAASPVTFDGYAINSPGEEIDHLTWTPVAGNYDSVGDTSVASSPWFVLSETQLEVAEAGSVGSGVLAAGQTVSLGTIWPTAAAQDFSVIVVDGLTSDAFIPQFVSLAADYDDDLDIDLDDYQVFVDAFGSSVDLAADGNGDGVVDGADYTLWRDAFAANAAVVSPIGPAIAPAGLAIPEPGSLLLLAVGGGFLSQRR